MFLVCKEVGRRTYARTMATRGKMPGETIKVVGKETESCVTSGYFM